MHTIFIEYTKKVKGCEKVNEKREKRHAGQKGYDRIFFLSYTGHIDSA